MWPLGALQMRREAAAGEADIELGAGGTVDRRPVAAGRSAPCRCRRAARSRPAAPARRRRRRDLEANAASRRGPALGAGGDQAGGEQQQRGGAQRGGVARGQIGGGAAEAKPIQCGRGAGAVQRPDRRAGPAWRAYPATRRTGDAAGRCRIPGGAPPRLGGGLGRVLAVWRAHATAPAMAASRTSGRQQPGRHGTEQGQTGGGGQDGERRPRQRGGIFQPQHRLGGKAPAREAGGSGSRQPHVSVGTVSSRPADRSTAWRGRIRRGLAIMHHTSAPRGGRAL